MVSELEALSRIQKPTQADKDRMSELRRNNSAPKKGVAREDTTPHLSDQFDKLHEKFIGKIEPWTIFTCTTCRRKYHLIDGAPCECGKEDSDRRQNKYIGEAKIGTETR